MRILIVEDQLDVLECLRAYSSELGYEVVTACTADEAIRALHRAPPDLAFIDLILPQGNGRQVVQEIFKNQFPARTVVITACDDLDIRKELKAMGVSEYLFKPVTIRDLDQLLRPPQGNPSPEQAA